MKRLNALQQSPNFPSLVLHLSSFRFNDATSKASLQRGGAALPPFEWFVSSSILISKQAVMNSASSECAINIMSILDHLRKQFKKCTLPPPPGGAQRHNGRRICGFPAVLVHNTVNENRVSLWSWTPLFQSPRQRHWYKKCVIIAATEFTWQDGLQ